jgi:hypothetical protein
MGWQKHNQKELGTGRETEAWYRLSYSKKQTFDESQKILGKLSVDDIVRLQINRCNLSAGDPFMFNRNVEILMLMLPSNRLSEIKQMGGEYVTETDVYTYTYSCGRKLGTPGSPFYVNTPDSPFWDGGEKILVSPIKQKMSIVDYDKLYSVILRLLEESGLTWKEDTVQIEGGDINDNSDFENEEPTPTYNEGNK